MVSICKNYSDKFGMNAPIFIAFFIHEEDLPFTIGATKDDFYCLKDILNKVSFKGTTPFKYLIFTQLKDSNVKRLYQKEDIAFKNAMVLNDTKLDELCNLLDVNEADYNNLIQNELVNIKSKKGKEVNRSHISKYLNILDNIQELKFYEQSNLMWKVKYNEIPD